MHQKQTLNAKIATLKLLYHLPPKAEGYRFVHVRQSFRLSVPSHYYVTTKLNFMTLILNMYHYNDVMHFKFGLTGLGSS